MRIAYEVHLALNPQSTLARQEVSFTPMTAYMPTVDFVERFLDTALPTQSSSV